MNRVIRFGLILVTGIWFQQCMSAGIDSGMIQPKYKSDSVVLWNRPNEVNLEIQDETVTESAELTYVFGISTSDENKNDINKVINPDEMGEVVEMAAAKASEKAESDGFLVVHTEKVRKGLYPIYYTDTYKVKGKPVKVKSLGVMSKGRFDARRRYQAGNKGLLGFWDGLEQVGPPPKGPSRRSREAASRAGMQVGVAFAMPEPESSNSLVDDPNGFVELGFITSRGFFFGANGGWVARFGDLDEITAFGEFGIVTSGGLLLAGGYGQWFEDNEHIASVRFGYVFTQGFNASLRLKAIQNRGGATYTVGVALGQTLF